MITWFSGPYRNTWSRCGCPPSGHRSPRPFAGIYFKTRCGSERCLGWARASADCTSFRVLIVFRLLTPSKSLGSSGWDHRTFVMSQDSTCCSDLGQNNCDKSQSGDATASVHTLTWTIIIRQISRRFLQTISLMHQLIFYILFCLYITAANMKGDFIRK